MHPLLGPCPAGAPDPDLLMLLDEADFPGGEVQRFRVLRPLVEAWLDGWVVVAGGRGVTRRVGAGGWMGRWVGGWVGGCGAMSGGCGSGVRGHFRHIDT